MKIVLTGMTGVLGHALIPALLKENHELYIVARDTAINRAMFSPMSSEFTEDFRNKNELVHMVYADIRDTEKISEAIPSADLFFHFAWEGTNPLSRAEDSQRENVIISERLFILAMRLSCKAFCFSGSQAEYGFMGAKGKVNEDMTARPVTPYGKAKLETCFRLSSLSKDFPISYYHFRFFSVYGPYDRERTLVSTLVRGLKNGENVPVSAATNLWNFLYSEDAAKILIRFIEKSPAPGIYNIGSPDTKKLSDFIRDTADTVGKGTVSYGAYIPKDKPVNLCPDISKMREVIGTFSFTPFQKGITEIERMYL